MSIAMATVSFEAPTATHTLNQKTLIGLWKYVTSAFFFFFFSPLLHPAHFQPE